MSACAERIGYRIWSPVQREDEIVLTAYFTDYVWKSRTVGGTDAPPPNRDLESWEWIAGYQGCETAGFFACPRYADLLQAIDLEGLGLGIHGVVALGGDIVSDDADGVLRAQAARILGFRDELPCWTCLEADHWQAGVVSVLEPRSGVGSGCGEHAGAELDRASEACMVMTTDDLLEALTTRYRVPLLSEEKMLALEAA